MVPIECIVNHLCETCLVDMTCNIPCTGLLQCAVIRVAIPFTPFLVIAEETLKVVEADKKIRLANKGLAFVSSTSIVKSGLQFLKKEPRVAAVSGLTAVAVLFFYVLRKKKEK